MARKKRKKGQGFLIKEHVLVPKHLKISETEKKSLFTKYTITQKELPKISIHDPAISDLDPKPGDIIKVLRNSKTAGSSIFYRVVITE